MFFSLAAIIVVLFFAAWWFRRGGRHRILKWNAGSRIKILEKRPLSPKAALYLIETDGKRFLVSESPGGVHPVAELSGKEKKTAHSPLPFPTS